MDHACVLTFKPIHFDEQMIECRSRFPHEPPRRGRTPAVTTSGVNLSIKIVQGAWFYALLRTFRGRGGTDADEHLEQSRAR